MGLGSIKELYEFAEKYGYDLLEELTFTRATLSDKQRRESSGRERV